ncbi:tetratricopeptide repeat protein [Methylobrevis albus]|uniref:Tetratricopeptide repeat protein n=1 Tax=Methylobrevis albus TaxID=2793297 RepID=A0A931N138_9HYPH|nr:tetratricopeptide repeat protein [Methylobrevis albus]MBH0239426.1 tetratricopeptide repeat protein [Methylobrevis albus]
MSPRASSLLSALMVLCLAGATPALAVDTNDASEPAAGEMPPGYAEAAALVKEERFAEALPLLKQAESLQPAHADTLNLLGFTSRMTGDVVAARGYYDRALKIAPNHRGAREYRGELFVKTGDLAAARRDLAELERICGVDCEEYRELADAIAAVPAP